MKTWIVLLCALGVTGVYAQPPAGGPPPKAPTMEERLGHVSAKIRTGLALPAAKHAQVVAAYKTFFTEMDALRKGKDAGKPGMMPQNRQAVEKLAKKRDERIKLLLEARQYQQYQALEKTMRPPPPPPPRP